MSLAAPVPLLCVDTFTANLKTPAEMEEISHLKDAEGKSLLPTSLFSVLFPDSRVPFDGKERPWEEWGEIIEKADIPPDEHVALFGNAPSWVFFELGKRMKSKKIILASCLRQPQAFLHDSRWPFTGESISQKDMMLDLELIAGERGAKVGSLIIFITLNKANMPVDKEFPRRDIQNIPLAKDVNALLLEESKATHIYAISPQHADAITLSAENFGVLATELELLLAKGPFPGPDMKRIYIFACPTALAFVAGAAHRNNVTPGLVAEKCGAKEVLLNWQGRSTHAVE